VSKRLTYASWVQQKLVGFNKVQQQSIRNEYYSDYGRVSNYDFYVKDCKSQRYLPDAPPEGYWSWAERGYEKPITILAAGLSALLYLIVGVIAGSTGTRK